MKLIHEFYQDEAHDFLRRFTRLFAVPDEWRKSNFNEFYQRSSLSLVAKSVREALASRPPLLTQPVAILARLRAKARITFKTSALANA